MSGSSGFPKRRRPRGTPSIFQVPDAVPRSRPIKGGMRELPLHTHVMSYEGKKGQFRVSLKEIHATGEARQKDRRDIYHILSGTGSVVIDGEHHQLRKGSSVVIAPNAKFSFKASSARPLIALHVSV